MNKITLEQYDAKIKELQLEIWNQKKMDIGDKQILSRGFLELTLQSLIDARNKAYPKELPYGTIVYTLPKKPSTIL